jgi:LytS/YehU family sensor histidine kinase
MKDSTFWKQAAANGLGTLGAATIIYVVGVIAGYIHTPQGRSVMDTVSGVLASIATGIIGGYFFIVVSRWWRRRQNR